MILYCYCFYINLDLVFLVCWGWKEILCLLSNLVGIIFKDKVFNCKVYYCY